MKYIQLIDFVLILIVFSAIFISGCKEVSYIQEVPYQVEEQYYADEPYTVQVPYTITEEYQANESYQVPLQLDLSGYEIQPLVLTDQFTTDLEDGMCVGSVEIDNPNDAKIYFDIEYVVDVNIVNTVRVKNNQSVKRLGTYTLEDSGPKPYWTSGCGNNNLFENVKITILDSPDINNTFRTEWHMVTKQRQVTQYRQDTLTRQVVKTRAVTKYQAQVVTEHKFLWQ